MSKRINYTIVTTYRTYGDAEMSKPTISTFKSCIEVLRHMEVYDFSQNKWSKKTVYKTEVSDNYIFHDEIKDLSEIFENGIQEINALKEKYLSEVVTSDVSDKA